jgi:hypothetical protein
VDGSKYHGAGCGDALCHLPFGYLSHLPGNQKALVVLCIAAMGPGSLLFPTDIESAYTYRHYHWGLGRPGARTDGMGNCPNADPEICLIIVIYLSFKDETVSYVY